VENFVNLAVEYRQLLRIPLTINAAEKRAFLILLCCNFQHPNSVMWPIHVCRVTSRVTSPAIQIRVRVESWLGRFDSESSHKNSRVTSGRWFARSSQCRVK